MIKFYRHIRKSLLMENKTSKPASQTGRYLKYAIGEIFLVVIGILIALQVNNWNTEKQSRSQYVTILKSIQTDIKNDIRTMNRLFTRGKTTDSLCKVILNESYNIDTMSVREKRTLFSTGLSYQLFKVSKRGYKKLEDFNGDISEEFTTTNDQLSYLYETATNTLEEGYNHYAKIVLDRYDYLSLNTNWFHKFSGYGEYTQDEELFFTTNPIYKNWIQQHSYGHIAFKNGILNTAYKPLLYSALIYVNNDLGITEDPILDNVITRIPKELQYLAGSYLSEDQSTTIKVEIVNGYLIIDDYACNNIGGLKFTPIGDNSRIAEFKKDASGQVFYYNKSTGISEALKIE